ncbi:hypothetical protein diail_1407 [Diaporthe ilicicola]|nr:hypothetical protein diail_1407 [Diaporthe ilicicola]
MFENEKEAQIQRDGAVLALPNEYPLDNIQSEFCVDRFSPKFFTDLLGRGVQYCDSGSSSTFTCFHGQIPPDTRVDAFCIGQNARFDFEKQTFVLDCPARDGPKGLPRVGLLSSYWYETGSKVLYNRYMKLVQGEAPPADTVPGTPPAYTYLLKREGAFNPWHCLMEIMSMTFTMDALRLARDPASLSGAPLFNASADIVNTQVVVVDDDPDGPYFDLWTLFSGRKPRRLSELTASETESWLSRSPQNVILPLAGGGNQLWQNDWEERDCTENPLLRLFVRRVLAFYSIPDAAPPADTPSSSDAAPELTITFINRVEGRRLQGQERLLDALRASLPARAHLRSVDMASLSFAEQLRVARTTDVLVGVHGAGLTHMMFLPEGDGAVVEIQPEKLDYNGFRNMALMRQLGYFTAHGARVAPKRRHELGAESRVREIQGKRILPRGNWHGEDVAIEEGAFVSLVLQAATSVYSKRRWELESGWVDGV